jgi:5-oxoprolinase (ATP-hydrolysing)
MSKDQPSPPWRFWIDVGGTFTDCLAVDPHGVEHQIKVLSSSAVKGVFESSTRAAAPPGARWLGPRSWQDDARANQPPGFWYGYTARLLDEQGRPVAESRVTGFDSAAGSFELADEVDTALRLAIVAYELLSPEPAPLLAIRSLMGLGLDDPLPDATIDLGTTRGTNALLTRTGAPTVLVTTAGLGDILEIGDQTRPDLFALAIRKRQPLAEWSLEIHERVLFDGSVEVAPDPERVAEELAAVQARGARSVAICLMHSWRYPEHERLVGQVARRVGFREVRCSHEVAPLIKIVPRAETTVLDAYLNPVLGEYLNGIAERLRSRDRLRVMTSAGGLVPVERFSGKDSLMSGPAGGVVGLASAARRAGFGQAIGLDMGGTSTDVARWDGAFELEYESVIAGVRVVTPHLAIETIAAGGGSLCRFDGVRLLVGPDSAGAEPGPACYGRGGPLTLTDINLYAGRLFAERFPWPLDRAVVVDRLTTLAGQVREATGQAMTIDQLADGFFAIANVKMADAIRRVSLARGIDPRGYTLVAFGGAAGQHACRVAEALGIASILVPRQAGILSAVGIRAARPACHRVRGIERGWSAELQAQIDEHFAQMADSASEQLRREGARADQIQVRRQIDLRYRGALAYLTIDEPADRDWTRALAERHEREFGYTADREIDVGTIHVIAETGDPGSAPSPQVGVTGVSVAGRQLCRCDGRLEETPVVDRTTLSTGDQWSGPVILTDSLSTTVVDPGWLASVVDDGAVVLTRQRAGSSGPPADGTAVPARAADTAADSSVEPNPIAIELFNNYFTSIARQMGIVLERTACSVNVKERLDFSCAIFDALGRLVVNAPHIPVHLGAMGHTIKALRDSGEVMSSGDVFVTNDPAAGGTHLPDLTVITPVFDSAGELTFFVASRAHHAEIGGRTPGSMSPAATCLAEEGVLIRQMKVVDRGSSRLDELRRILVTAPFPSRLPDENIADVVAQIAANQRGIAELTRLCDRWSTATVVAFMQHMATAAEQKLRQMLSALPDRRTTFCDRLDNGAEICVAIEKAGSQLTIDFTGTSPVQSNNLNANPAIVTAAVYYVLRTMLADDIPLNEGIMNAVRLVLPPCLLNPTFDPDPCRAPAVAGGNVETSQRVVDVLLGALGLAAASQGTMNNLLIGSPRLAYYETIGGGAGATAEADGAAAVHTHMTNTRLTDPEILESRLPVVLRRMAVRRGSGGNGRHRGGDGMIRELEFRDALVVTLLTNRRGPYAPYGMAGGGDGALGINELVRAGGATTRLGSAVEIPVARGDRLTIATPGGGGWGTP